MKREELSAKGSLTRGTFGVAFEEPDLLSRCGLNFAGTRLQRWFYTSLAVPSSRVGAFGVGLFGNAAQRGW